MAQNLRFPSMCHRKFDSISQASFSYSDEYVMMQTGLRDFALIVRFTDLLHVLNRYMQLILPYLRRSIRLGIRVPQQFTVFEAK